MKFEKAEVTIIELNEEDVISTSGGCLDAGQMHADSCTTGGFKNQGSCTNKGNMKQWG